MDASKVALDKAKENLPQNVKFVHGTFENTSLINQFDSIFMINVLEHVDDAVLVLRRSRDWLNKGGRVFLIVPNANAASRQIAVRMGLISHNQAVTEVEYKNGHRRTYALDTFQRDLHEGGFHIERSGGLVFKGLANYQLDKAFEAGIITSEYLEACYDLGIVYPDLCASLFAVCSLPREDLKVTRLDSNE
jgi:2-polyprenyl-3-methyl-5-hydroxy-6-metoxy-1,4-benzoquinol methylase